MKYYLIYSEGLHYSKGKNYRVRDEKGRLVHDLPGEFWAKDLRSLYSIKHHLQQGDKVKVISEEQLTLYKLGASPEGDIDGQDSDDEAGEDSYDADFPVSQ